MEEVCLSELKPGEHGIIKELGHHAAIRRRLRDIGFLPGTGIDCLFIAPSGSPIAFYVKGTVVALRQTDCECILVDRCE